METNNPLTEVQARLAAAFGKPAWGTTLGDGSFLTVEFGQPLATTGGKTHGEFHLWIYLAAWRLENASEILAASEDSRESLQSAVQVLDGRALEAVAIESPSLSATFTFDGGITLRAFSVMSQDADHWMFYLADKQVFTAGPGTTYSWDAY